MTLQELYDCVKAANPEYLNLPLYARVNEPGFFEEVTPNDFDVQMLDNGWPSYDDITGIRALMIIP